jgi:hypothetical protein
MAFWGTGYLENDEALSWTAAWRYPSGEETGPLLESQWMPRISDVIITSVCEHRSRNYYPNIIVCAQIVLTQPRPSVRWIVRDALESVIRDQNWAQQITEAIRVVREFPLDMSWKLHGYRAALDDQDRRETMGAVTALPTQFGDTITETATITFEDERPVARTQEEAEYWLRQGRTPQLPIFVTPDMVRPGVTMTTRDVEGRQVDIAERPPRVDANGRPLLNEWIAGKGLEPEPLKIHKGRVILPTHQSQMNSNEDVFLDPRSIWEIGSDPIRYVGRQQPEVGEI